MNELSKVKYTYLICAVAAFGGLLFGYDTAVIAGAIGYLQVKFELSPMLTGWAASSAIWGCVFGALFSGALSDKYGRKKVLLLSGLLFTLSALGSAVPDNLTQFVMARFIGGLGVGSASMLSPLYISEIAPAKIRGMLVTLYQLAIVFGINIIYIVNYLIANTHDQVWNVQLGWRYMLGSEGIPAILFFILLFFVPESPRWLVKENRSDEALKILNKINGPEETHQILKEIKEAVNEEKGSFLDLFKPGIRKAMVVGSVLALFSQVTGINAIIYYAPEIFKQVGFGSESALFQTMIIGFVNMLFTLVAIRFIDYWGRRTLLIWGISGMVSCLLGMGMFFYFEITSGSLLLLFILGFIASFASSLGPIPWVLISEIFPTKTRGTAMSFSIVILWLGVVLITQFFPVLLSLFGGAFTFWIFMINALILLIFTLIFIPETKQKTLEEIQEIWKS
ncbi:sugar porter family MFS transporter [Cyclobacteriaceae bacterium]|jgi:SP family arabinose:H+ symporter-like MFS transporter|nr:sugar porter family MFS transporter [Cyclobacteriaceae bacterium]MDB9883746.1 sugar porter family MFS transporter [Cyclobacteriaceae bacterium]MDC1369992.1 sugar porter family MFS transporter [Cyclobacteriaceae bacterium]MDC6484069.1 sugar porter family MFS transporter [Cyclobacteriaceae bacterium]